MNLPHNRYDQEPFFSRVLGVIQAGAWMVFIWGPLLVAMMIFGKGGKEGEPQGRPCKDKYN